MINAQEVIDNYTMSYFNKNYDIEASMEKMVILLFIFKLVLKEFLRKLTI